MELSRQLDHLVRETVLVALLRGEFDSSPQYGFLVGSNSELIALHCVSDRYDLDGYRIFLRRDLTSVEPRFARRKLISKALELKQLKPAVLPWLDLTSMRNLIASIEDHESLVVIHRERLSPNECEIGRVRIDSDQTYSLFWITTEAEWELDNRVFRYSDITQLEFGGEYERTLAMVGGPPPEGAAQHAAEADGRTGQRN